MKRILFALALSLLVVAGIAQTSPSGLPSPNSSWGRFKFVQGDSGVIFGPRDTSFVPRFAGTAVLFYRPGTDTSVWIYYGGRWNQFSGSGGANNYVTSLAFNNGTGILTLGRDGLGNLTTDFDGRYLRLSDTAAFGGRYIDSLRRVGGSLSVEARKNGVWTPQFTDSIGGGGTGSVEYVVSGTGVIVDSAGRVYTINVDTAGLISSKEWFYDRIDSLVTTISSGGIGAVYAGPGLLKTNDSTLRLDYGVIDSIGALLDDKVETVTGNIVDNTDPLNPVVTGISASDTNYLHGISIASYGKNAGDDSTILILNNGTRFAAKDSVGSGGGGMTNPMTTTGDIIYSSDNSGTPARLGVGSTGQVLTNSGTGIPSWSTFVPYVRYIAASKSAVAADGGNAGTGTNGGSNANAYNFFIGANSGYKITTGTGNITLGKNTLDSITDAVGNIAIGNDALAKMTATSTNAGNAGAIAIGNEALFNFTAVGGTSSDNMAIGRKALYTLSTGNANTAIGLRALELNATGINNTAIGVTAGSNATGSNNVDIGYQAGSSRTTGDGNINIGSQVGYMGVGATSNVLLNGVARTSTNFTGSSNMVIGGGVALTSGSNNVLIGRNAGNSVTTGSRNVIVSPNITPSHNLTTGQYNTMIGDDQSFPSATGDNQAVLGFAHYMNTTWRHIFNGGVSGYTRAGALTYNASTAFDFQSINGGLKFPTQTTAQWTAISSKATGIHAFDSDRKQDVYYDGTNTRYIGAITLGTAAPATTPTATAELFLDTTNKKLYVATGTASSADWTILN